MTHRKIINILYMYTVEEMEIGMATGRVRAGFFYTRTRPAGQDPRPEPDLLTKWVFLPGPVKGLGPICGSTKKKIQIQTQSQSQPQKSQTQISDLHFPFQNHNPNTNFRSMIFIFPFQKS